MPEQKDEWYVSRGGQRFGPVTFAELCDAAKSGRLEPRTDMVVGGGLAEWKPAGEIDGLFERHAPAADELEGDPSGHTPPKDSMADSGSYDFNRGQDKALKLPGAPRLGYFLGVTVLPVLLVVGLSHAMPQIREFVGKDYSQWAELLLFVVPALVVVVITVKRFQNLAMTGWWWFGLMVPFLNLWLYYRLFACPAGYAYTKKLDGIGKVLAVLYWLSPVVMVVAGIVFAGRIREMQESGELQELIERYERQLPKVPELPKKSEAPPSGPITPGGPQF